MYVFDRAYNDFTFWEKIKTKGSDFVTRLKSCTRHRYLQNKVLKENPNKDGVLYDGPYESQTQAAKHSTLKLRQIIYRDKVTKKIFHFVTSDFKIGGQLVADIYKRRWSVELLFRWLKGHLQVRRLPSRTANAVKVQLAIAVLLQLLIQLKRMLEKYLGSLWDLLRDIRTALLSGALSNIGLQHDCRWNTTTAKDATKAYP